MTGGSSLRAADARLLSPVPVRRAQLLGAPEGWAHALDSVGIEVVDESPDLVVAAPGHAESASLLGAPAVLLLGSRRRELSRAGYLTRTFLVRQGPAAPRLFVPVDARNAAAHALLSPMPGRSAAKRLAIRATLRWLRAGLPLGGAITLGTRVSQPPRIVAEALGATTSGDWYLLTGEGDDLQRMVWFCFDGRAEPAWVIKCSRVPGHDAPFVRDEESLASLDVLPDELRRHAPRLTTRLQVDGLPAAVETAAPGQPLHVLLQRGTTPGARVVGLIADWIVELAAATRLPPGELAPEVARLAAIDADVAGALPLLPAVLQHNDLGCWNVLVHGDDFTVVDWESSRRAGLPLWDLVYFLTDALTAGPGAGKEDRVAALLRGELDASHVLFTRLRSAAERMRIPLDVVGPIVTLAWLHHGRSARHRGLVAAEHAAETRPSSAAGPLQQVTKYWLTDPALGTRWPAFNR
jgi:phosphotransferase family enzyme